MDTELTRNTTYIFVHLLFGSKLLFYFFHLNIINLEKYTFEIHIYFFYFITGWLLQILYPHKKKKHNHTGHIVEMMVIRPTRIHLVQIKSYEKTVFYIHWLWCTVPLA